MKRCPECRRDYFDDTLSFCLADGTELVYGVADDESPTAVLPELGVAPSGRPSSEDPTLPQIDHAQAETAKEFGGTTEGQSRSSHRVAKPLAALIVVGLLVMGAFFGYRYLTANTKQIESIAVMPFVNESGDPDAEYLSDGMTETLISSLSKLPNLNVKARSSVFRYKGKEIDLPQIARELNVQAILTGRVTQRGDNFTVSLELADIQTENTIWSGKYNRKIADVFTVQEEIAGEISEKLRLKLTGNDKENLAKSPTENLKAFQYYMQGRSHTDRRTREDLLAAIHFYEKAIEQDRNYALAHAGLAEAYAQLGLRGYILADEGRRKALEATRTALELDKNLAEAHVSNGLVYVTLPPLDFSLGDRELKRAIELSPSLAIAHFYLGVSLVRQGRFDEGLERNVKARELDPLSPIFARQVSIHYFFKRDYARALEHLRQANELGPAFSVSWEVGVYVQNGLFDEALAELEKAKQGRKNDPILIYSTAMVYAARGQRAEALNVIRELEDMSGARLAQAHVIAKIYSALNEKELALSWLERGLDAGAIGALYKDEPVWDPIRTDVRFAKLTRRMGFPE